MNWRKVLPFQSITRRQILDSSKLKAVAEDNFKFDEECRKLSKWVENTVGKEEIACHEQFLLFPQCFQKACFPGLQKVSLCGNGLTSKYHHKRFLFKLQSLKPSLLPFEYFYAPVSIDLRKGILCYCCLRICLSKTEPENLTFSYICENCILGKHLCFTNTSSVPLSSDKAIRRNCFQPWTVYV